MLTRAALGIGRPVAAGKATGLDLLLRRMDDVLITAAGRRQQSPAGRVDAVSWANQPHGAPTTHHQRVGISRADSSPDVETRRRRWIAYCLRHAYKVGWVPEVAAANVVQVEWRAAEEILVLTLRSGTQLIDRFDRIEVLGEADETAIAELVAAAKRRGWQAARVFGTPAFRVEAARALLAAGITVEDPPLSSAEIEALRAAANIASPQAHRSDDSDVDVLMPEAAPPIERFPEFTPAPRPPAASGRGHIRAYGQRLDSQFAELDHQKIADAVARWKAEKTTPGP